MVSWGSSNHYEPLYGSETSSPNSPSPSNDETITRAKFSLRRFGFFLLPSPIQRRLQPAHSKPQRLYATSWLDGLRGLASLIVFFCHYTENFHYHFADNPYGWPPDDPVGSSPIQLPFLRMIYCGRPMVPIFFVISGFVLSFKSLKLAHAHNYAAMHTTLSSSVFRRALRLFLPCVASTFLVMITIWYELQGGNGKEPTLYKQFWSWLYALWDITNSWNWDLLQWPPYDVHLWTIPIEMANSMLLFITITGLSRCKVWIRLFMVFSIMLYCLKTKHWAGFEFLGGMLIAEIGLIQAARAEREANKKANSSPMSFEEDSPSKPTAFPYMHMFWVINVLFALWVGGWPNKHVLEVPGLRYLAQHTMDPYFTLGGPELAFPWYALGAMQIVLACQQVPWLQNFFITAPIQYLANISYALYLMHGPIMDVLGLRIMSYVLAWVGEYENSGIWLRTLSWFLGLAGLAIPTVWAADVFWRAVDLPSVAFAKWLEVECIVKDD